MCYNYLVAISGDDMDILKQYGIIDKTYYKCIEDLISNELVLSMKEYIQHGKTTTLDHCIAVSYNAYKLAKVLNLDFKSVARGALLHDFYLYDWHNLPKEKHFFKQHGFVHAKVAKENALKYFELNEVEVDIIEKHMWPLNITKMPMYRESVLVTLVDKYVSTNETVAPYIHKMVDSV